LAQETPSNVKLSHSSQVHPSIFAAPAKLKPAGGAVKEHSAAHPVSVTTGFATEHLETIVGFPLNPEAQDTP
jgi:hypothetical protein